MTSSHQMVTSSRHRRPFTLLGGNRGVGLPNPPTRRHACPKLPAALTGRPTHVALRCPDEPELPIRHRRLPFQHRLPGNGRPPSSALPSDRRRERGERGKGQSLLPAALPPQGRETRGTQPEVPSVWEGSFRRAYRRLAAARPWCPPDLIQETQGLPDRTLEVYPNPSGGFQSTPNHSFPLSKKLRTVS